MWRRCSSRLLSRLRARTQPRKRDLHQSALGRHQQLKQALAAHANTPAEAPPGHCVCVLFGWHFTAAIMENWIGKIIGALVTTSPVCPGAPWPELE